MTSSPFQLPDGIREDDLIDLVDGRLTREREGLVLGALRDEPALANLVKGMRADMATAVGLEAVRAPSGLAEGIEARLEAAALRDLAAAAERATDAIPISSVEFRGPGIVELLTESVWPRRLAMAASLAIVAGLGVWGVRTTINSMPGPAPKEIATTRPTTPDKSAPTIVPTPAPMDIAAIDNTKTVEFGPGEAITPPVAPVAVAMTEARAAELASEGRLAVTIHAVVSSETTKRLDALAKAGGREGWRALPMGDVPVEYAMLLAPSGVAPSPTGIGPRPITVASERPLTDIAPGVALRKPAIVVKAIYTVDVNPGEKGMGGLVRAITDALPEGAVIELRETARRAEAPPAFDAESVLWWNGAPAKWARRITVPIVVEGLE
ncbi:MAG TPA: hypothetical protein PKE29_07180 [Phycisphaerales bacterium]|nr:hypothetical protein [Phycisphaerales bacterium]